MTDKEKDKMILENMQIKYNHLVNDLGYEVMFMAIQGSQNYLLDVYDENYQSDVDVKAVVLPHFNEFCRGRKKVSTTYEIGDRKEHIDVKDIYLMFETFCKQNINFLEILFTKYKIINPKYKEQCDKLFAMRHEIASIDYNKALCCISGMSQEKKHALCHPYPAVIEAINKYGFDKKQLYTALRMNDFIKQFVKGNKYEDCLVPLNFDYIKKVKSQNMFTKEEAIALMEKYDLETKMIKDSNLLPDDVVNHETIEKMYKLAEETIEKYFIGYLDEKRGK